MLIIVLLLTHDSLPHRFPLLIYLSLHPDRLHAMKVLKKNPSQEGDEGWRERMWTERNILANIDHPFLTRLRYAFESRGGLHLVMDLYLGGELFVHLGKMKSFDELTARQYCAEIFLALEHLHELDIVYRDIKPENLLLDERGHIRLTDFGLSKQLVSPVCDQSGELQQGSGEEHALSFVGSPEYIAPEVLLREPCKCCCARSHKPKSRWQAGR